MLTDNYNRHQLHILPSICYTVLHFFSMLDSRETGHPSSPAILFSPAAGRFREVLLYKETIIIIPGIATTSYLLYCNVHEI